MIDFDRFDHDEIKNWIMSMLPAIFSHHEDSNTQATLAVIAERFNNLSDSLINIYNHKDLENASGKELDDVGNDWGVSRIDNDDEFMRFLIRLARIKSQMGNTENDLIRLISYALQAEPSEFTVETRLDVVKEVEAIIIKDIPDKYNTSPKKVSLLKKLIRECVATEVRILDIIFEVLSKNNLYFFGTSDYRVDYHFRQQKPSVMNNPTNTVFYNPKTKDYIDYHFRQQKPSVMNNKGGV